MCTGMMAFSGYLFCNLMWVLFSFTNGFNASSSLELNDDVLGLIVFKASLMDPNMTLNSWNEDDDSPCSWKYVKCDPRNGRVTEVVLEGLGLSGRIGRGLEKLEYLQKFSVAHNNFSGNFNPDVAQIASLKILNMSYNRLSGRIPDSMGFLRFLDLSNNAFSGPIPYQLFGGSLRFLSLAGNMLSGPIFQSLPTCLSLTELNLSANHLSGSISGSIWALGKLRVLDLSYNNFVGILPVGIGRLHSLREVYLQNNGFSGPLAYDTGDCSQLTAVDFSQNEFSGNLPQSLQGLNLLVSLKIQGNRLVGSLPSWIGNLTDIKHMDISSNKFNGNFPASVGALQSLRFLNVSNNGLSGAIPGSLIGCSRLSSIDLSHNLFSGSIPEELFQLGLEKVDLSSNNLTGLIPSGSYRQYEFLRELDLSNNMLAGGIPVQITLCFNLKYLNLSGNLLEARIPPEFGDFRFMEALDLSYNKIHGTIPGNLCNPDGLMVLQLDGNLLGGQIPAEIGNCSSLYFLSLSHNHLEGPIPVEITKIQHLAILNLSNNSLTGKLPMGLASLSNLIALNVSYNKLEGRIPTEGIFQRLNKTAFEGNADLCGANVNVACQMDLPKPLVVNPNGSGWIARGFSGLVRTQHKKIVLSVSTIVAISAAAAIVVGVVVVTVLNIRTQKQLTFINDPAESTSRSLSSDLASGKLVMFSPNADPGAENWISSAHALLRKDCEIGKGGFGTVYKTIMGNGRVVAIKKLMVSNLVKSQEDFEKEVQLLGKMKHPNLVSLIGYYWTPELQLLIYDYVTNGSLYSRLHDKSYPNASLNWKTRFKIALGTARGLAHLHQACRPPVIHYNIKSSNVLLDEDFNPRISDYGLAKLLPMLDRYILSSKFQGALGYVAPEFACQSLRINEKCDVYGFGVLILELITGSRPVEYVEDDVVIMCDYVRSLLDQGNVLSCIDPNLHNCSEEEITPMIKLGLVCTSQVPSSRPSMAEVVQILDVIKTPIETRERL